jgi:hypothetical protein
MGTLGAGYTVLGPGYVVGVDIQGNYQVADQGMNMKMEVGNGGTGHS